MERNLNLPRLRIIPSASSLQDLPTADMVPIASITRHDSWKEEDCFQPRAMIMSLTLNKVYKRKFVKLSRFTFNLLKCLYKDSYRSRSQSIGASSARHRSYLSTPENRTCLRTTRNFESPKHLQIADYRSVYKLKSVLAKRVTSLESEFFGKLDKKPKRMQDLAKLALLQRNRRVLSKVFWKWKTHVLKTNEKDSALKACARVFKFCFSKHFKRFQESLKTKARANLLVKKLLNRLLTKKLSLGFKSWVSFVKYFQMPRNLEDFNSHYGKVLNFHELLLKKNLGFLSRVIQSCLSKELKHYWSALTNFRKITKRNLDLPRSGPDTLKTQYKLRKKTKSLNRATKKKPECVSYTEKKQGEYYTIEDYLSNKQDLPFKKPQTLKPKHLRSPRALRSLPQKKHNKLVQALLRIEASKLKQSFEALCAWNSRSGYFEISSELLSLYLTKAFLKKGFLALTSLPKDFWEQHTLKQKEKKAIKCTTVVSMLQKLVVMKSDLFHSFSQLKLYFQKLKLETLDRTYSGIEQLLNAKLTSSGFYKLKTHSSFKSKVNSALKLVVAKVHWKNLFTLSRCLEHWRYTTKTDKKQKLQSLRHLVRKTCDLIKRRQQLALQSIASKASCKKKALRNLARSLNKLYQKQTAKALKEVLETKETLEVNSRFVKSLALVNLIKKRLNHQYTCCLASAFSKFSRVCYIGKIKDKISRKAISKCISVYKHSKLKRSFEAVKQEAQLQRKLCAYFSVNYLIKKIYVRKTAKAFVKWQMFLKKNKRFSSKRHLPRFSSIHEYIDFAQANF